MQRWLYPLINIAVILAMGSRRHQSQLIYNRPRTMLPALGKPMVVRIMDKLYRNNIKRFVVVLGETEADVALYLQKKWLPNVEIEFILKKEAKPLGPVLAEIAQKYTEPFIIASYNNFPHPEYFKRLIKYHDVTPSDLILSGASSSLSHFPDHTYINIDEKKSRKIPPNTSDSYSPAHIVESITTDRDATQNNALILANIASCGENFVAYLANTPPELNNSYTFLDVIRTYLNFGYTVRVARTSWILQIEKDADLLTLHSHLLEDSADAHILSELPYTVKIKEPVRIDPGVSVGQGAVIGPYVYIENGASIGRNAQIKNAVIMERAVVQAGETIEGTIVSTQGHIQIID